MDRSAGCVSSCGRKRIGQESVRKVEIEESSVNDWRRDMPFVEVGIQK